VAAALAVLWLVWGSTYLGASWVLPVAPPFVLSAARFAVAAPLLALAALAAREPLPSGPELASAAGVGGFLFLGGNGGTVFAQTYLPSSLTAVMVGLVPLWLVLLGAAVERELPPLRRVAGALLGMVGVAGLAGGIGGHQLHPVGVASVVTGTLCWATGSLLARRWRLPRSIAWSTAVQMAAGSAGLWVAATATGQLGQVHLDLLTPRAVASFWWLVLAGSLAALMAYNWLLRVTTPAIATTYAYVNPVVAVWLGWWLGGEQLTAAQVGWSLAVVAAVALVTTAGQGSPVGRHNATVPAGSASERA
jgi:drug/metabolite transporter (DMT)-like permease